MICRLPSNILHSLAYQILLSPKKEVSWFNQVESVLFQYGLPHPLQLLQNPPGKEEFKNVVKLKVADYWQQHYRALVSDLPSLDYFKPELCSLLKPHPILYSATNSYEVNKMVVQLRLLSGRARLGSLTRHFSPGNNGICELCELELEDLQHFLLPRCPALLCRANILLAYMEDVLKQSEACLIILGEILQLSRKDCRLWVQFVLDCSVIPQVVQVSQTDKAVLQLLFKVTRTWCYSLHRTRLKLMGRWCT